LRLATRELCGHYFFGGFAREPLSAMWWLCFERDGRFLGVAIVAGETPS
jgi:hypothetical protein